MPSWSEIVKPKAEREQEKVQVNPVKKVPVLLCVTCGRRNAIVCEDCKKRPLYQSGYCGGCYVDRIWRTLGSDSMCIGYIKASDPKNDPPLECRECMNTRRYNRA
jgi:hypothetical protein